MLIYIKKKPFISTNNNYFIFIYVKKKYVALGNKQTYICIGNT